MKARDVIGRRIVAVRQQRVRSNAGRVLYHLDELELDDGTVLKFTVTDRENDSVVEATTWPPKREKPTGWDLPFCVKDCVHAELAMYKDGVPRWECARKRMVVVAEWDARCGRRGGPKIACDLVQVPEHKGGRFYLPARMRAGAPRQGGG
jgi:hypothetical protein